MAMQIMYAKTSGKNIEYSENSPQINVTDNLNSICNDYFKEEAFLEDGETIIVQTVHLSNVKNLSERIESEIFELLERLKKTRGDEAKAEIIAAIKDYTLFRSLIISMLLSAKDDDVVLTIS